MAFTVPAGMDAWPPRPVAHEHGVIALGIDVDIVRRRKSLGVGADNQGCLARYGIGRSLAGGEVDNIAAGELLRANQAVKAAFFPVANREHIIRRKRECRGGVILQIVRDITHSTRFLVGTDKHAQRVRKFLVLVFEKLHAVQRNNKRTFVVQNAASKQKSVLAQKRPGVERPADAGSNHVGMADHAKHGVAFTFEIGYADLTRVVSGVKAESLRQVHRSAQAVMRLGTTWVLRGRTIEIGHARNGDEPCDFLDDFFPVSVDKPVNFGHEIRVGHYTHPLSFWACLYHFTRFSFRKPPAKNRVAGLARNSRSRKLRLHAAHRPPEGPC